MGLSSEYVYAVVGRKFINKNETIGNDLFVLLPNNIKKYDNEHNNGYKKMI